MVFFGGERQPIARTIIEIQIYFMDEFTSALDSNEQKYKKYKKIFTKQLF